MDKLFERIRKFNDDRDWNQFHSSANLAKSIVIEAAELLEQFQWSDEARDKEAVKDELADVLIYCYQLAIQLGVDVENIMADKMDKNETKYPIEKSKGSSKKYSEFSQ
jgi:NTP pyrophosphatase (non-canonical NTP hydrolase)